MSLELKHLYKLDITERNGVSDELKLGFIDYFQQHDYYILVEEGGEGTEQHYHLHGILRSDHSRTDNLRRSLKPMYKIMEKQLTTVGVRISVVSCLAGALSYVYKDKRVLTMSGILLDNITEWKSNPVKSGLKGFTQVGKHNYVQHVTSYCDAAGIRPQSWEEVRNVMSDMIREKYMFGQGNWCKEVVGKVLQYYGERKYVLAAWDMSCNFHC